MNERQIMELARDFINKGKQETTNGSYLWYEADFEEYGKIQDNYEAMRLAAEIGAYDSVAEINVYLDKDNGWCIDCIFWLDYCYQTCRPTINVKGEKLDLIIQPMEDSWNYEEDNYDVSLHHLNWYALELQKLISAARDNGVEIILRSKKEGIIDESETRIV